MPCFRYLCSYLWRGQSAFFLWHGDPSPDSNDCPDSVEFDRAGRIPTFATSDAYAAYVVERGYNFCPEPVLCYDLDQLATWCDDPSAATLDQKAALDAWNLFADVPGPADEVNLFCSFDGRAGAVYEKLFFAQNLPAVTPPGEHYVPTWTADELRELSRVLRLGLAQLTARLRPPAA